MEVRRNTVGAEVGGGKFADSVGRTSATAHPLSFSGTDFPAAGTIASISTGLAGAWPATSSSQGRDQGGKSDKENHVIGCSLLPLGYGSMKEILFDVIVIVMVMLWASMNQITITSLYFFVYNSVTCISTISCSPRNFGGVGEGSPARYHPALKAQWRGMNIAHKQAEHRMLPRLSGLHQYW